MQQKYDVWFNCTACPSAECSEPLTRDVFLAGVSRRESEYKRLEELNKNKANLEADRIRRTKSFVETIRRKVEDKELLSQREFVKAFGIADSSDRDAFDFFSPTFLIGYQLSLLGYENVAAVIVSYIDNLLDTDW
jgi:hypothetical protein